jgi:hypothetical protein
MDIIFKYGEHYYDSCDISIWIQFGLTLLGAFLGFGFALLIYFINVKREKREKESRLKAEKKNHETKKQNESRNILKYNGLLIDNLIANTNRQIESIAKFKIDQEKNLLNIIVPNQVVTNDFQRLILINRDIFESFNHLYNQDYDWIEELKKIHANVDFIEGVLKEFIRISTNHLEVCYKNSTDIKQKIELIPDKLSSYAFFLQKQLGEDRWNNDLYIFIDNEIKKYSILIEKKADLNEFESKYLEPLIKNIMSGFKGDDYLEEIIFLAKNSRVKIDDIKVDVKDIIETFDRISKDLSESKDRVIDLNKKINNVL